MAWSCQSHHRHGSQGKNVSGTREGLNIERQRKVKPRRIPCLVHFTLWIYLFTSPTAIPNSPCSPYLPAFLCRALAWAPYLGSGEAAAGDACCTQLPPSGQQQHFGLSKVVLASQTTNNFFSSLSLSQRNLFLLFFCARPRSQTAYAQCKIFLAAPPF